jgi:putative protease
MTVKFWEQMGAKMCVLAREVSFPEIVEIREKCPNIRLEMFVHGAMCMSYSGRCLISNFLTGRGANQGNCAHSCRWKYRMYSKANDKVLESPCEDVVDYFLEEDQRRDEFMQIEETERGTFLMSSKDLCLMPVIDKLIKAEIDCFKVEGRNKSEYYTAVTARAYRMAIDSYFENTDTFDHLPYLQELETLQSRGFTLGFFNGVPDGGAQTFETTRSDSNWRNVGVITAINKDNLIMELRNEISKGEEIEFLSPFENKPIKVLLPQIIDAKTELVYDKLSAGHERSVLIKKEWLGNNFDKLPVLSVARKRVS